jgi:hypothetical protein
MGKTDITNQTVFHIISTIIINKTTTITISIKLKWHLCSISRTFWVGNITPKQCPITVSYTFEIHSNPYQVSIIILALLQYLNFLFIYQYTFYKIYNIYIMKYIKTNKELEFLKLKEFVKIHLLILSTNILVDDNKIVDVTRNRLLTLQHLNQNQW